jgi:hypothetical protein
MWARDEVKGGETMNISTTSLSPFASLVFGVLILIFPKFLNYFVAAYLIIIGVIGLGLIR